MQSTIAIIGAGFSGTVLAAKLLREPPPGVADIVLVERNPAMGRGLAYATRPCPYLLNVPAGRLSADATEAAQFLRFAQRTLPEADGEDFLPRQLYGDYLEDLLAQAERTRAPSVKLTCVTAEAVGLERHGGVLQLRFADREPLQAQRVVLALGNPPPQVPSWAEPVRGHPAYCEEPWNIPAGLSSDHVVLVIGNGQTMVDVVFSLTRAARAAPHIVTLSRHGLMPLAQSTFRAAAVQGDGTLFLECGSVRQLLAATRSLARDVERLGGDWREVITFVRGLAPAIWQRLPPAERRRFVRHLQSYWDIHRHRMPAQLASHLEALRHAGRLQVHAGRILRIEAVGERLRVTWRRRGGGPCESLMVDLAVSAIGPDYSLRRARNPLLQSLRTAGWVSDDGLDLGLRTAETGACIDLQGRASADLFYLGPMLRADHWEATAVTELRDHAERLARQLRRTA